ncbi:MFS transporter [Streptomyces johnsoniae]|uniref:MFS transporter n=1 Tax=Streptomyces johnsoniae TaxID=3075532 RepID=A0ABU2RY62_9ACTN|nr:MFS transporter [Streptomyces sp. DSM 41886]MDT0441655.1 MFS transporter [Streptomyces sp. DSM 41886]
MTDDVTEGAAPAAQLPREDRGLGSRFWTLWSASTVTNLGQGASAVAFPWLATTLTNDAFLVALTGVAVRLPWLLFSLPAGVLADRLDRRHLMLWMSAARALIVGVVALLVALDAMSLPVLCACALALGFAEVLFDNTAQVLLPSVVARAHLPTANGRLMAAQMVSDDFVARPLGGALLGFALAAPFVFDAGAAVATGAVLLLLRGSYRVRTAHEPGAKAAPRRSMRAEIAEGVRWLWGIPVLRRLAVSLAVINGSTQAALAVYVLYAQEVLGLGPVGFAVLTSAAGAGGVLGGLLAGRAARRLGPARSLLVLLALQVIAFAAAAVASHALVVGVAMSATGFGAVLWNVTTVSLRQTIIPDRLLGRVNSVYRLLGWGAMPLGMLAGGGLVALVEAEFGREAGLRAPFLAVAVICAALTVYVRRHLHARAIAEALADAR